MLDFFDYLLQRFYTYGNKTKHSCPPGPETDCREGFHSHVWFFFFNNELAFQSLHFLIINLFLPKEVFQVRLRHGCPTESDA